MPYIEEGDRAALDFGSRPPETVGELNYCLTSIADEYLVRKGVRYETLNAVVGALECAKQELLRRVVGPYEDRKRHNNGDVYQSLREAGL